MSSLTARSPVNAGKEAIAGIQGIIFDCDGVLFDSKEANTAYYNHIRLAVHLPPISEEQAAYSHMASADEALASIIPPDLMERAFDARDQTDYSGMFLEMMQPARHVYSFLNAMKKRGLPLALCTNRTDSVRHVLRHFAMESFFSPVMTISRARPKPDPQGLLEIVRIWDVPPDSVIFLGDSLVDKQAAASAAIPFWSFNNLDLPADMHVPDFKDLEDTMRIALMR